MELNWKPCRVVHCYKIENGVAHIIGFDGVVRLNESATIIWDMSNGKNSLKNILSELEKIYDTVSKNELRNDLETILNVLSDKGLLVKDWDPLLKDNISQKENLI
ncbi:MAG: PqqD family protein [Lachnospiraceae bacterium]|nr:PqqD family protein [Lachnospiraceae bacterium]